MTYGDEGDEDGGQEQPQQHHGMNGSLPAANAGAQKVGRLAAYTCYMYLLLFLLLFYQNRHARTHKSHCGRGVVMRSRSSGKTTPPRYPRFTRARAGLTTMSQHLDLLFSPPAFPGGGASLTRRTAAHDTPSPSVRIVSAPLSPKSEREKSCKYGINS